MLHSRVAQTDTKRSSEPNHDTLFNFTVVFLLLVVWWEVAFEQAAYSSFRLLAIRQKPPVPAKSIFFPLFLTAESAAVATWN